MVCKATEVSGVRLTTAKCNSSLMWTVAHACGLTSRVVVRVAGALTVHVVIDSVSSAAFPVAAVIAGVVPVTPTVP